MVFAILEFRDPQTAFGGAFFRKFFCLLHLAVDRFVALDFVENNIRDLQVFVEKVNDGFSDSVDDGTTDIGVSQLVFGLRFKDGVGDTDGNGAHHTVTDSIGFEVLA